MTHMCERRTGASEPSRERKTGWELGNPTLFHMFVRLCVCVCTPKRFGSHSLPPPSSRSVYVQLLSVLLCSGWRLWLTLTSLSLCTLFLFLKLSVLELFFFFSYFVFRGEISGCFFFFFSLSVVGFVGHVDQVGVVVDCDGE